MKGSMSAVGVRGFFRGEEVEVGVGVVRRWEWDIVWFGGWVVGWWFGWLVGVGRLVGRGNKFLFLVFGFWFLGRKEGRIWIFFWLRVGFCEEGDVERGYSGLYGLF